MANNMYRYRKFVIILINVLVILWLLKILYFDHDSDVVGFLGLLTIVFLVFYDLYAALIIQLFFKKNTKISIEGIFILLLIIPFVLLWLFTK